MKNDHIWKKFGNEYFLHFASCMHPYLNAYAHSFFALTHSPNSKAKIPINPKLFNKANGISFYNGINKTIALGNLNPWNFKPFKRVKIIKPKKDMKLLA